MRRPCLTALRGHSARYDERYRRRNAYLWRFADTLRGLPPCRLCGTKGTFGKAFAKQGTSRSGCEFRYSVSLIYCAAAAPAMYTDLWDDRLLIARFRSAARVAQAEAMSSSARLSSGLVTLPAKSRHACSHRRYSATHRISAAPHNKKTSRFHHR